MNEETLPPKPMSFVDKVRKSRDRHLLRLVTGKNQGSDAWWYIRVKPEKMALYVRRVKSEFIDLADYGEILYCGWGKEPPEDIKKKIEEGV